MKKVYPEAVFNFLGAEGNIKVSDIQEYIDDGSVNYLGTTNDVRPYLEDCSVLVLPSYREGMPMSIMEAMSVGRGIIATNVPGCKDTVEDGINGYLIEKDTMVKELKSRMVKVILDKKRVEDFSLKSREICDNKFEQKKINCTILNVIEQKEYNYE